MDIQIVLGLSGGIMAFVEYLKTVFAQIPFYAKLTQLQQSIVLQTVAFFAGIVAAVYGNINAFPSFHGNLGIFATGLIAAGGSAFVHIVYSWLGMKGGVTADSLTLSEAAPGAVTYAPFM